LYITPEEAISVIPKLPTLYDEPFSDCSQIPTFLVSQLARQHVTVSLSGDGGDELFAGYNRYIWGRQIWQQIGWMPYPLRHVAARGLMARSPQAWNRSFARLNSWLPKNFNQRQPGDKLHKLAEVLAAKSPEAMYMGIVSHWKDPESLVLGASEPTTTLTDPKSWAELPDFTERMMYWDTMTYLPDDILTKVDRATMGVGLEARVPFLDHRVVEFAWKVPLSLKIRNGQGKWLLRQLLYQYVPSSLIDRPKMGFAVPIDDWLRGSLRDWAEALLSEHRLRQEGFFNPQLIRQKWTQHLGREAYGSLSRRNWQYYLWDVLMFQAWLDTNVLH
jgi:asparagine synthase (glutamine-hydrolysing)